MSVSTGSRPIGMGCMRLSTDRDRDEGRAIAVLHAALDAGATFLDTSDAYCLDDSETGHNERLIARALATWRGDASRVEVATKGGLTRPDGQWVPDGRARHLTDACEASLRALGVSRLSLYQFHAPDPRTSFATSVRALASLQRAGLVDAVGLCNVTVGQIDEARRIADIASVQVELSVWNDDGLLSGVAAYCATHGIRFIAHRPLGGAQRARKTASDPLLVDLAGRHNVTPADIAIAWLLDLHPTVLPIPGPTRVDTAALLARPFSIQFTDDDRARLDERFPSGEVLRTDEGDRGDRKERREQFSQRSVRSPSDEIVMVMGLPAAGKSTLARTLVERGYARVNRDEAGGSLRGLVPAVERLVAAGQSRIVLDNTYMSRKSRAPIVRLAATVGVPVRCVWLSTSVEDAQVNAVVRQLTKFRRLLQPDEMRQLVKHDPAVFGPSAQFRCQRELEPPELSEGFSRIDVVPFERRRDASFTNRALVIWCDGVLARPNANAARDWDVDDARGSILRRYADEGWLLLGLGWQPGVADEPLAIEQTDSAYARMRERLGLSMDILYCPHGAGPPVCWCRKPLPGLGVVFIERYRLDPARTLYVGNGSQDPGFARRLGFQYQNAVDFFGTAP